MKFRFISAFLVAALVLPVAARAQEYEHAQGKEMVQLITWQVQPDQMDEWEAAIKQIVEAAQAANLTEGYGWSFYSGTTDYTLVYPIANYAYFDDPMQWMRQFEGTEGDATLKTAMASINSIEHRVINEEIAEGKLDWSYMPGDMADFKQKIGEHKFVHLDEFWVRPGKSEEFSEVIKEYMTFFNDIGYAYPIMGHETKFGESGRAVFVTVVDELSDFYGANSFRQTAINADATDRMQALWAKLTPTFDKWERSDKTYEPELTYRPDATLATN